MSLPKDALPNGKGVFASCLWMLYMMTNMCVPSSLTGALQAGKDVCASLLDRILHDGKEVRASWSACWPRSSEGPNAPIHSRVRRVGRAHVRTCTQHVSIGCMSAVRLVVSYQSVWPSERATWMQTSVCFELCIDVSTCQDSIDLHDTGWLQVNLALPD